MTSTQDNMIIRALHPSLTIVSFPFMRFDKIAFGGRTSLVKLSSGGVAAISPGPLTPQMEDAIKQVGGPISFLITPDIEHHISLGAWKAKFSDAKVVSMEGMREKRAKQGNEDVQIDYVFTKENKRTQVLPKELADDFEVEYWDSHANKELVFLHKQSKSLINADLLFNLPATEQFSRTDIDPKKGVWYKLASLFATLGKGQQRFHWYVLAKDKQSYTESAKIVHGWDFDRIVSAHGDVIETGGKDAYEKLFAWFL